MNTITIQTTIKAPVQKVWEFWNDPKHIVRWAFASRDWEAPSAENDVRVGGRFKTLMAAKDKSAQFDFGGTYTAVKEYELIEYDMDDRRHVRVEFKQAEAGTDIIESFEPEHENSEERQRLGWQAILDNFKKYVEAEIE